MVARLACVEGVHAALVTPFRPGASEVDLAAALELVDFAACRGVDGIVLLGTTGEFVHLDVAGRLHLAQFAIKRSRLPVTVNVSHSTLEGALALARGAISSGASALLLMPPYFYRYGQEEVEEFYLRFARELGRSVPLLLYNIPLVSTPLHFETAVKLIATGFYAGIKDSSGEVQNFRRLLAVKKQAPFALLAGADAIFPETRAEGGDGVVSGVAGAVPELMAALDRSVRSGGPEEHRDRLTARLLEFLGWCDRLPPSLALKEALAVRGVKTGPPAVPLTAGGQGLLGRFREWFSGWLLLVLKESEGA